MRTLAILTCALIVSCATIVSVSGAAAPEVGLFSLESGRGVVLIDVRGNILGRLTSGSVRVTDLTPLDRHWAYVAGRKITQTRLGPRTVLYRGQGLRFRMLGGRYRVLIRGAGIDVEAVGRGLVTLDGEPRFPGDDVGLYSLDGADCGMDPLDCDQLPLDATPFALEPSGPDTPSPRLRP
jgi:hypothetical protein